MTTAKLSKTAKNNASQTFGVEIELLWKGTTNHATAGQNLADYLNANGFATIRYQGYTHDNYNDWKIVYDSSVNGSDCAGLEVVSPILTGQDGMDDLAKMLDALTACESVKVSKACGIHVHLGGAGWRLNQHRQFAALGLIYEGALMATQPDSRQGSRWCRLNERDLADQIRQLKETRTLSEIGNVVGSLHDRYRTWNYNCFSRHGTVECRMHAGSVDSTKVTTWAAMLLHMAGHAAKLADQKLRFDGRVRMADTKGRLELLTSGMRKTEREYVAGRFAAHGGRRLNAAG